MPSSQITANVADVYEAVLTEASGPVFAVGLSIETARDLLDVINALADPPTVRLLLRNGVAKRLREDFITASTLADLIATDMVAIRTTGEPFESCLLITEESVLSVFSAGNRTASLVVDDPEFVQDVREQYSDEWANAEEIVLRTPPRSRIHDSLASELDPAVESDFRSILESLETVRGSDNGLNEVAISLLAAANNEALYHDISTWGENIGLASRATFSRQKQQLEDRGLISTEKMPTDMGRPRQRLKLNCERLSDTDTTDFANVARHLLSSNSL